MNNILMQNILSAQVESGRRVDISVTGISMEPTFYEGDTITIVKQKNYVPGDILVFSYKGNALLVHRLLKTKENIFYCKGDNSLRLEDITEDKIFGKVVEHNKKAVIQWPERFIELSYLVNRAFIKNRYDADATRNSNLFKYYYNIIRGMKNMTYQKNQSMEYIQTDASSLAVFDSESGDTHFFDEIGIDILNCLSNPVTIEMLLGELCKIYNVKPEEIKSDVEEFLDDTVAKKVVIVA